MYKILQVLNPEDGSVVRIMGILDPLPGSKYKRTEFNQPTDIAVNQDRIVIADMGNKRIKVKHRISVPYKNKHILVKHKKI